MPSVLHKKAPYRSTPFLNTANSNDTTVGGALTTAPANYTGSQLQQNYPGDRIIFNPADAYAASNNTVGNLYAGSYRYLQFRNNSTSSPTRGHAFFWDPTNGGLTGNNIGSTTSDSQYMVTTDGNAANYTNTLFGGVCINNITLNNGTSCYWWGQESGKASCKFRGTLTGTPQIGQGVYNLLTAAANNNANDNGAFDVFTGANSAAIFTANSTTAYNTVDAMIYGFIGVSETLPSNNNISIVDMRWSHASIRF